MVTYLLLKSTYRFYKLLENNMRILWLNWRDIKNPEAGGAEVMTHEIARRLADRGHDVTLFTSLYLASPHTESIDNVRIIRKGNRFSIYGEAKKFYKLNYKNFDLVIDEINVRPFMTPKYVKGLPVVALIHQISPEQFTYELPFPLGLIGRYYLEKKWLSYYRNILTITVSNSTKISLEDLNFKRVYVIEEGLSVHPLEKISPKENVLTITFIGRLKKHKLPDHAVLAFRKIANSLPGSQMFVIGNGYMLNRLKQLRVNNVTFFGHIDDKRKYELLSRSHLVIVPATREGWGLVVIEANAMGTPVVAYSVPGLVDSVRNNINGILLKRNTPDEMADTVITLLKDQKKLVALSTSSLEYSRKFNWENTTTEFEKILKVGIDDFLR